MWTTDIGLIVMVITVSYIWYLQKAMATHSSVLAWRIPGMGEPGGRPSMASHGVGHDWSDLAASGQYEGAGFWLITTMSSGPHTIGEQQVLRLWDSPDNTSDGCFSHIHLPSFHLHLLLFFSLNKPIYNSDIKSEIEPSVSVYQVLENTFSFS